MCTLLIFASLTLIAGAYSATAFGKFQDNPLIASNTTNTTNGHSGYNSIYTFYNKTEKKYFYVKTGSATHNSNKRDGSLNGKGFLFASHTHRRYDNVPHRRYDNFRNTVVSAITKVIRTTTEYDSADMCTTDAVVTRQQIEEQDVAEEDFEDDSNK